jgi:hypothetical protein
MALAPQAPTTYAVGVSAYLLVSGLCYAAFSAVVLDSIGVAGAAASTQYTLFTSAGNAAIAYTGFLDAQLHERYGVTGLLLLDAALNLGGVVALALVFARLQRGVRRTPRPR